MRVEVCSVNFDPHFISYARLDGAEFVFGKEIQKITEKGPIFRTSILNEKDEVIGCEKGKEQMEADATLICISQDPRGKAFSPVVMSCMVPRPSYMQ